MYYTLPERTAVGEKGGSGVEEEEPVYLKAWRHVYYVALSDNKYILLDHGVQERM